MTVTASDLFQEYEGDFVRLSQEVAEKLEPACVAMLRSNNLEQHFHKAERQLAKADQVMRQMEMEARTLPADGRSAMEVKVRQHRMHLTEQREALALTRQGAARQALLHDNCSSTLDKSLWDRERLINVSSDIERSSLQVEEAHRQALESERIGLEATSDLRQQRYVILRARGHMNQVHLNIGTAKRMLDNVARCAAVNRTASYVAMGIMSLLLLLLAFFAMGGSVGRANTTSIHS